MPEEQKNDGQEEGLPEEPEQRQGKPHRGEQRKGKMKTCQKQESKRARFRHQKQQKQSKKSAWKNKERSIGKCDGTHKQNQMWRREKNDCNQNKNMGQAFVIVKATTGH